MVESAGVGGGLNDIALSRNSRYLYALGTGSVQAIYAFRIQNDGSLQALGPVGGLPAGTRGLAAFLTTQGDTEHDEAQIHTSERRRRRGRVAVWYLFPASTALVISKTVNEPLPAAEEIRLHDARILNAQAISQMAHATMDRQRWAPWTTGQMAGREGTVKLVSGRFQYERARDEGGGHDYRVDGRRVLR